MTQKYNPDGELIVVNEFVCQRIKNMGAVTYVTSDADNDNYQCVIAVVFKDKMSADILMRDILEASKTQVKSE